jgi:hypothetical protein
MKLQFRHQQFQADAANAVCDVFAGQPFNVLAFMIDPVVDESKEFWFYIIYQPAVKNEALLNINH